MLSVPVSAWLTSTSMASLATSPALEGAGPVSGPGFPPRGPLGARAAPESFISDGTLKTILRGMLTSAFEMG